MAFLAFRPAHASGLSFGWPGHGPAVIAEIAEVALGLALTGLTVTAMLRTRDARSA